MPIAGGCRQGSDAKDRTVEVIEISERDHRRILDLLENAPQPNAKLLAAARALPASRRPSHAP